MMTSFQKLSAWLEGIFGLFTKKSFIVTERSYVEMIVTDNKIAVFVIMNEEEVVNDVKSLNFHKSICERSISRDSVVVEVALLVYFKFPINDSQMCEKYKNLGPISCDTELNRKINTALDGCLLRKKVELKSVNTSEVDSNVSFNRILQRDWKHKKSYFTVHLLHKIAQLVRGNEPMINHADIHFNFLFPTHLHSRFYQSLPA